MGSFASPSYGGMCLSEHIVYLLKETPSLNKLPWMISVCATVYEYTATYIINVLNSITARATRIHLPWKNTCLLEKHTTPIAQPRFQHIVSHTLSSISFVSSKNVSTLLLIRELVIFHSFLIWLRCEYWCGVCWHGAEAIPRILVFIKSGNGGVLKVGW